VRADARDPGHTLLVARSDADTEQCHEQATGAAAVETESVANPGQGRDLLFDLADLGTEVRVVFAPVPTECPGLQDLHDLGDLFLADQLYAGSGHAGLPPSACRCATDCTARYKDDNLTANTSSADGRRVVST